MLYAEPMADGPKSGGRWGDLVALGIGTGLIAYFTSGRDRFGGFAYSDDWWVDVLVVVGCILALAGATMLLLRIWDALMARLRRR